LPWVLASRLATRAPVCLASQAADVHESHSLATSGQSPMSMDLMRLAANGDHHSPPYSNTSPVRIGARAFVHGYSDGWQLAKVITN
jgi:hypothetical protein